MSAIRSAWSRRWFLLGGAAVAAVGAAGAALLPALASSRRWMIQRVIYFYAPGIVFDGQDLDQFAAYVERRVLARRIQGLRGLDYYAALALPYHSALARRLPPPPSEIATIDQQIMDAFFLCSDFFEGPWTPGRRITLSRPPDPYEAGCSNPLADMTLAQDGGTPASASQ